MRHRWYSSVSEKLLGFIRKTPPVAISNFAEVKKYGPNSCEHVQYPDTTLKDTFSCPKALGTASQKSGLFGNPLLVSPQSILQYWDLCKEYSDEIVSKIIRAPPSVKTVYKFDDLSNTICYFADCVNFLSENSPNHSMGGAASLASRNAAEYVESLNTNIDLYDSVKSVLDDESIRISLTEEQLLALKLFIFDMEKSGISLPSETRTAYVNDNSLISEIGSRYVDLANQPSLVPASSLPVALKGLPKHGKFAAITGPASESSMHEVREYGWLNYHSFDEEKEKVLVDLLKARHTLASRIGFQSFAERELQNTMAETVRHVQEFLDGLHSELQPLVDLEIRHLQYAKAEDLRHAEEHDLYPWCARYYSALLREEFLTSNHISGNLFLDLLTIGNIMNGMNLFCEDVLGISLVPELPMSGELWNRDVVKMSVYDESDGLIGYIYCDFFARKGKDPRTCLHTITCGTTTQIPVVVISCGFRPPTDYSQFDYPKLSLDQLHTLFHEFGHALHAILGRTTFQHTSGTRGPTDFAEIPSSLFENFISHPAVYSRVLQPSVVYADDSHTYGNTFMFNTPYQAIETQTTITHAILDLAFHTAPNIKSTVNISEDVISRYSNIKHPSGTAWHHRFTHLYFYGAKYYSYLWSKSAANLIFYNLFYDDPLNPRTGRKLKEFLKKGASVNYKQSVDQLIGYEYDCQDMVGAIVEPIKLFNDFYLLKKNIPEDWW